MIPKIPGLNFGGGYDESSSDQLSNTQNATSSAKGSVLGFKFDSGVNFGSKKTEVWQWAAAAIAVTMVVAVAMRVLRKR